MVIRPVWQLFLFYSHNRGQVRAGDNRVKRAAWNSERGKRYVDVEFHVRKVYCICWPKVNWEHFVGACQNAEQMLQQESKQFTQHWQSRAEGKELSKYGVKQVTEQWLMGAGISNTIIHLHNMAWKDGLPNGLWEIRAGGNMFQCDTFIPIEEKVISEFQLLQGVGEGSCSLGKKWAISNLITV